LVQRRSTPNHAVQSKNSTAKKLKVAIVRSLRHQGYRVRKGLIMTSANPGKSEIRRLHEMPKQKKILLSEPALVKYEPDLLQFIANGNEVEPTEVRPKLMEIDSDGNGALLFRYACLHWSIPVSTGYGRRLRFLVMDESNGKLIGIIGLGDPVFGLQARDQAIGWDFETKKKNLYHVMDAYVLGAVPPYSMLLCGKLVSMLALSNEVRQAFRRKYARRRSLIKKIRRPPYLALLTTTSALGRSSVYNRIRINGFNYWRGVGYTKGSGELHFSDGVYEDMFNYVTEHCEATAKQSAWGTGFRNKREVVRKCLSSLRLSPELIYHGIKREIFVAPLAERAFRFLKGEVRRPHFYDWPADELALAFRQRWLLPRSSRVPEFRDFRRESYRIWPNEN
jgi:hypothetical protein